MPKRGVQCDFDCFNCIFSDCTNSSPAQSFETEMLDAINGSSRMNKATSSEYIDKLIEEDTKGKCFCVSCAREKPNDGLELCKRCIEYYNTPKRRAIIVKKQEKSLHIEDYLKNKGKERKRIRRQERRNAGLCVQCGKPNSDLKYFNCTACREKDRIKAQKAREKLNEKKRQILS